MQNDLDAYLEHYNTKATPSGRNMNGLTPINVFSQGVKELKEMNKNNKKKADQISRLDRDNCQVNTITVQIFCKSVDAFMITINHLE